MSKKKKTVSEPIFKTEEEEDEKMFICDERYKEIYENEPHKNILKKPVTVKKPVTIIQVPNSAIEQYNQAQIILNEMSQIKLNQYIDMNNLKDSDSEILQKYYKYCGKFNRNKIFNAFRGKMLYYSTHKYFNYLINVIIKYEGENKEDYQKIKIIADELKGSYYFTSKNDYGTYAVQNLIKYLDDEEYIKMIYDEVIPNQDFIISLNDQNLNRVVQNLIEKIKYEDLEKLFNEKFKNNIKDFCKSKFGCHFIQSIIKRGRINLINAIISEIKEENYIDDEKGIHVIEKLLSVYDENGNNFDIKFIYEQINASNIYPKIFSEEKSISPCICQIIEYIIQKGKREEKEKIINKLFQDKDLFSSMFPHQYGNHVVQKVYQYSNNEIKKEIKNILNRLKDKYENREYFNFVEFFILNYK